MGYNLEYVSTVFKSPWATTLKERWEARKAINNLRASDKRLYQKLPGLVEKEHRVTAASREEDVIIKELKISAANGYSLAFNVATMDMAALKAINQVIDSWLKVIKASGKFSGTRPFKKLEAISQLFRQLMDKALGKAIGKERDEMKDVMILVNESVNKNHSQFMEAMRLRFQKETSQSMLAKLAIRSEIISERRAIRAFDFIAKKCDRIASEIESAKGKNAQDRFENAVNQLEALAKEGASDVEYVFEQAYLIKRRDFLLMLKLIVNSEVLKGMNRQWLVKHFMPEEPINKREMEIDKIEEKIAHEFHTIAQALRISINGIDKAERRMAEAA